MVANNPAIKRASPASAGAERKEIARRAILANSLIGDISGITDCLLSRFGLEPFVNLIRN
jgi:hypothetical protein